MSSLYGGLDDNFWTLVPFLKHFGNLHPNFLKSKFFKILQAAMQWISASKKLSPTLYTKTENPLVIEYGDI